MVVQFMLLQYCLLDHSLRQREKDLTELLIVVGLLALLIPAWRRRPDFAKALGVESCLALSGLCRVNLQRCVIFQILSSSF